MASEEVDLVLEESKDSMDKGVAAFATEAAKVRTGRASPGLLDGVMVDYYNTPTPLKKLATVNVPEPRLIVVQPFDPQGISDIERGILKANLGLTPSNDGKVVRVPIPELSEERRRELVKQVKKLAEEHKQGVRHARRDAISMLKDLQKEGSIDEDESRRGQSKVQDLTDAATTEIDKQVETKEEEILRV